jgi:hypothetical protein
MKFRIEITRVHNAGTAVVYRGSVDEISPIRAKTKAAALLNRYAHRGATGVRVLNDKNEELYSW